MNYQSWHLYSISQPAGGPTATSIKIKDGQPFKLADRIKAAPPVEKFDNNFKMETEFYKDKAEFILPVSAGTEAKNASEIIVEVQFQVRHGGTGTKVISNGKRATPSLWRDRTSKLFQQRLAGTRFR